MAYLSNADHQFLAPMCAEELSVDIQRICDLTARLALQLFEHLIMESINGIQTEKPQMLTSGSIGKLVSAIAGIFSSVLAACLTLN